MGRKPNALILQHFERGPKLNDSSNRYQHTCKTCGEKFPKGRLDSLTNHLVKKCPAISLRDRQKALLELNNLPDVADRTRGQGMQMKQPVPNVELSLANGNWTALETLAEVSRHMNLSEKRDDRPNNGSPGESASEPPRSENLELQEQYTLDNPPTSYESRSQRDKKMGNQKGSSTQHNEGNLGSIYNDNISDSRAASPNLAMVATAAAAARFIPSMVDPQLLSEDANTQERLSEARLSRELAADASMAEMFNASPVDQQSTWSAQDSTQATQAAAQAAQVAQMAQNTQLYSEMNQVEHVPEASEPSTSANYARLAMNPAVMTTEFSTEYGNGKKASKPKVRGRFSDSRRKEVQEVRKRGACIRCRMLKKPCSGETPCHTCKNVDNARLWKTPCVRTRLVEELQMYSANLHTVLAHHQVNSAKSSIAFRSSLSKIEVSHYPDTAIGATFNCLEAINMEGQIDPDINGNYGASLRILDADNDDVSSKLEAYAKRMMSIFVSHEPSRFMRTALNTALNLSIEKQDVLLGRALEFWAMVHIFVDHEISWHIQEKTSSSEEAGQIHMIPSNERSYGIIISQLNAAAEKKAAMMCKTILNELERRLLQHNKATSFEVFLIGIIVLNCIEKSTWLFKSWEQDSFKSRWPLDKNPVWYSSQGDKVTELLQMLLSTRSVPPKTYKRYDDMLVVECKTEGDKLAHDFFNEIQLSATHVTEKQLNPTFDPANSRCFELRYSSRLLQPNPSN